MHPHIHLLRPNDAYMNAIAFLTRWQPYKLLNVIDIITYSKNFLNMLFYFIKIDNNNFWRIVKSWYSC